MLSTENAPPDLCEIAQLKSGSDEDSNKKQQLEEVDLLKSGLDYNNPLPNFSIRDYVYNTRSKDIKNNWPFSQKNLQVCLKYREKDVLPPFQSLDSVRNLCIDERVIDSIRYSDVNIEDISLSECEVDKELPSTSGLEPEAQYLPSEKPVFAVRECKKAESSTQSPAKNCRLILKVNNIAEPKPPVDSAVNTPVVSETMTSKVCPVCKIFSSSSNTTLNAHIDQCLSGESVKWTKNSKVIKHRIKPRKTRLIVDIYETALHSTLEDLDKRNETNWASNMGLHPQDLEACAEKRKKTYSPVNIEAINQDGAVNNDSSGRKLRILSKLSHLPSKLNINDAGQCKYFRRDKAIKLLSSKNKRKKNHILQKLELQKKSLDGQGSCSPIPELFPDYPLHGSKSCYPRVEVNPPKCNKNDDPTKSPINSDHMKSDDFGLIKHRVGSKHTDLEKINLELENQLPDKSLKNLRIKSASSLGDRGNSGLMSPTSSDENSVLPPDGLKRMENFSRSRDGCTHFPCQSKEPGFSFLRSEHVNDKKNHLMSSKFNVKQSRKDSTSIQKCLMDPPNSAKNCASCSNKKMGINSGSSVKSDSSFIGKSISRHRSSEGKNATPMKKISFVHAISPGGRKFSSLRSKLSGRHASGAESMKTLERDILNSKSPRIRYRLPSDENHLVKALGENASLMEKDSSELLTNRTRVLKIRKKGGFVKSGKGDMTSKGSETSTESDSFNAGNKIDYFTGGNVPVDTSVSEEETEMLDDFVCDPTSTDGEGFVSFSKSLDSTFPGLTGSDVECVSQYYDKAYDEHCPTELVFHTDQEMFYAINAGKNLVASDGHEMAEMDGDEAQGNYFVDVDPIPIPGPPGSFLPSPGRMGSEEFLGHSSLTTCRIQSSDDGHEVVDMDSSDSPVSAMSTVSNSVAGRSSSISIANLSSHSHLKHESQLDITKDRINPVAEGLPEVTHEVQNIQPCCCSRKDVSLQGDSLNYQESQVLSRQTRTSLSVLAPENQVNDDTDNGIHCYDSRGADKEPTLVTRKDQAISPNGYTRVPVPHNSEAVFRACGDCEFPSPSNPVLRLMGKNLVVNKDDNMSPLTEPTQSNMMMEHAAMRLCVDNGLSTRNNRMLCRRPSMFDNVIPAQQFDFNSSDAFKFPTNYGPSSQLSYHPSRVSMSFGDNSASASGCEEYAGGFSLITDQLRSKVRPDARTAYDSEIVGAVHHQRRKDSYAGKTRK